MVEMAFSMLAVISLLLFTSRLANALISQSLATSIANNDLQRNLTMSPTNTIFSAYSSTSLVSLKRRTNLPSPTGQPDEPDYLMRLIKSFVGSQEAVLLEPSWVYRYSHAVLRLHKYLEERGHLKAWLFNPEYINSLRIHPFTNGWAPFLTYVPLVDILVNGDVPVYGSSQTSALIQLVVFGTPFPYKDHLGEQLVISAYMSALEEAYDRIDKYFKDSGILGGYSVYIVGMAESEDLIQSMNQLLRPIKASCSEPHQVVQRLQEMLSGFESSFIVNPMEFAQGYVLSWRRYEPSSPASLRPESPTPDISRPESPESLESFDYSPDMDPDTLVEAFQGISYHASDVTSNESPDTTTVPSQSHSS